MVTLLLTSGASNLTGWQLQKCMDLCQHNNWTQFISLQVSHYGQIIFTTIRLEMRLIALRESLMKVESKLASSLLSHTLSTPILATVEFVIKRNRV